MIESTSQVEVLCMSVLNSMIPYVVKTEELLVKLCVHFSGGIEVVIILPCWIQGMSV